MMEIEEKYAWQEKCLDVWADNQFRGVVQAVTGAGKTRLALKAMQRLELELRRPIRVKIVVPTKSLMSQWESVLKKDKLKNEFEGATDRCFAAIGCRGGTRRDSADRKYMIYVINSARYQLARRILEELKAGEQVLLIADECHHYTSGENRKIFDFVPLAFEQPGCYFSLGLSATLPPAKEGSLLWDALGKKIYNYSFEQALRYGTVCDFVIFQVALSFLPEEQEEYDMLTEEMRVVHSQLYQGYPLLREFGFSFFPVLKSLAEGKNKKLAHLARTYLMLTYQRKRIVCMAENSIRCACRLLEQAVEGEQCIVFGESIEQADDIYHELRRTYRSRVGRYHSRMGQQANQNALERFKNGEMRILIVCRALDEGVDVPETAVGIILSGTSMERQRVQRLGRILRGGSGKTYAKLYYLYIKDSREEKSYFPMRGERFKTVDLDYDVRENEFHYLDYERRMNHLLKRWETEKMGESYRKEAAYCLSRGMLRADWMLGEERIKELLLTAVTERERNYWICMREMHREFRDDSNAENTCN